VVLSIVGLVGGVETDRKGIDSVRAYDYANAKENAKGYA